MFLLADSGSTKTSWHLCNEHGVVRSAKTIGLNPNSVGQEQMTSVVSAMAREMLPTKGSIDSVFFYGAGCGQKAAQSRVRDILRHCIDTQHIAVETDMLGACRAVLGEHEGIVGILGTGSNVCHYRDGAIAYCPPSLGYMLDDEGSGTLIGKRLLRDYLRHRMPQDIAAQFSNAFPGIDEQYREKIYQQPNGNRFIASFASFAIDKQDSPYVEDLLLSAFRQFLQTQVAETFDHSGLAHRELHLVGGAAAVFEPTLRKAASMEGYAIAQIVKDPIDTLSKYHIQKN